MIVFNIMFYLPRSSNFVVQGSCFLPEISTSDLVLTLRNKNNIDVDNDFTLDSTLIPIVQLKVEKKDDQRWCPISEKDSKKESEFRAYSNMTYIVLSNPNGSSQLAFKCVLF